MSSDKKIIESCDIEIRVRYAEVDQMSVVHHSRYWVYFELGRTELLRLGGASYSDLEAGGIRLVVVSCSASYKAPARYDDVLVLTTRQSKVGKVKIEHTYELKRKDNGVTVATAATVIGCLNPQGKIIPLPNTITNP